VNEETAHATKEFITKRLTAIKNQQRAGEQEDLALVIGASAFSIFVPLLTPLQTARV